jgi:hypothetical protein
MIYQYTSIDSVIAKIIRNTRVQDTSYLFDMREWIPEAMGLMKTKYALSTRYEDVTIDYHKGKMPCDLHHIKAVEYLGVRLPEGNSSKHAATTQQLGLESGLPKNESTMELVITAGTPYIEQTIDSPEVLATASTSRWVSLFSDSLAAANEKREHAFHYYQPEMGYINTSFADGIVRVHYAAIPLDASGLPLIPDNEDYKQALYYYVRAMMIGAGYKDLAFNEDVLMQRFEGHAARAIGQIRYPSVDAMQTRVNNMVRFIPQENYFENFFRTDGPEGNY